MADTLDTGADSNIYRQREVRRGEYAREVAIADSSIPGSGLFFSTDNEMMVGPRTTVISIDTEGTVLPAAWVTGHTGSGVATQGSGELTLATNATANSRSQLTSARLGRRRSGATQWYISVWRLPTLTTPDTIRRWGMYDDNNGFFFQHDSVNGLQVGYRKAGVDTLIPAASMNGPILVGDLDLTKLNQFNVFYGGLSCRWHVNGRVLHAIGAGVPGAALTASVNLPIRAEVVNSNGQTANVQLIGRGVSFHQVGPSGIVPTYFRTSAATAATTIVEGPGTLRRILVGTPSASDIIALYDSLTGSGTQIVGITLPATVGNPFVLELGMEFTTGLTLVKTSGSNITIIYD